MHDIIKSVPSVQIPVQLSSNEEISIFAYKRQPGSPESEVFDLEDEGIDDDNESMYDEVQTSGELQNHNLLNNKRHILGAEAPSRDPSVIGQIVDTNNGK